MFWVEHFYFPIQLESPMLWSFSNEWYFTMFEWQAQVGWIILNTYLHTHTPISFCSKGHAAKRICSHNPSNEDFRLCIFDLSKPISMSKYFHWHYQIGLNIWTMAHWWPTASVKTMNAGENIKRDIVKFLTLAPSYLLGHVLCGNVFISPCSRPLSSGW